jgi:hypothetical protein
LQQPPTPQRTFDFEHEVEQKGRQTIEQTYNAAQAEESQSLPPRVRIEGEIAGRRPRGADPATSTAQQTRSPGEAALYASIFVTTFPNTSVSRMSRPWKR